MKTIAIIDDDVDIGNLLEELLQNEGYNVVRAYSGTEALLLLKNEKPDLILLDLMLPGISGEDVLRKIQNIPVIIISAKISVEDKVDMLLSGAVDYITKPFETRELLARIVVALRKNESTNNRKIMKVNDLIIDEDLRTVKYNSDEIKLTKTEYAIFEYLVINSNKVVSKSSILDNIFDEASDCTEDSLKQHICNIRNKIKKVSNKDLIESVWGIGYIIKD